MRRKDREMPEEFARMVTDKCEWAVLSMIDPRGKPYCVPISIVRAENAVYFHCAKEGYKTDCLNCNTYVCIACVGDTCRLSDRFTTEYESAVLRGKAHEVHDPEEKVRALRLLCERHTPANMGRFDEAIRNSLAQTAVWRVDIFALTGKCREVKTQQ